MFFWGQIERTGWSTVKVRETSDRRVYVGINRDGVYVIDEVKQVSYSLKIVFFFIGIITVPRLSNSMTYYNEMAAYIHATNMVIKS